MTEPAQTVICHCLAVRQGARQVTQFYDRHLAPSGLRTTQYSLLNWLGRLGPVSIHALADAMVMDRTTMGRALRPLERDGLVRIGPGPDGRTRALSLTEAGQARLVTAAPFWRQAQEQFEAAYGAEAAQTLRAALARLVATVPT
ncbi:winged helix-turn-helix transcriptional regulator [Methylobacterium sp. BTF04]|uniref:MarR family winged helix-turn-helix transcriptional regulator n=1 Tax=Methylobacterium sp. BTF04 TaxID=2708300 RepID=UPI0013D67F82|nr:MarR family winged helix-turn-helix transcriptional regulator [Methylobacterium sp. BTF04]NEU10748.1 winged helix-turn-helix transcriptional regulator [Methylobacterium sp. BTF04]